MLAADRLLLETNLRQSAIKLREKELNLYVENFSAMATQASVFAGFTTTCLIEIHLPKPTAVGAVAAAFSFSALDLPRIFLHTSAIISISANIICVSLATITSIYGSGKALRGKDGSMDEAVDAMAKERSMLLFFFSLGLGMNLLTVLCSCVVIMEAPVSYVAVACVCYTAWFIYSNASRIVKKFTLNDINVTRLDDLTSFAPNGSSSNNTDGNGNEIILSSSSNSKSGGNNSQRAANLRVNAKQTV